MNDIKPEYDVLVIGAGPAGLKTANAISEQGYSVVVIEEHPSIGWPVQCSGLVTPRVKHIENINDDKIILSEIFGATIYSATGKKLELTSKSPKAIVLDRLYFDRYLGKLAVKSGVELHLNTVFVNAKRENKKIISEIRTTESNPLNRDWKKIKIKSKILVGADGPFSRVATVFGFSAVKEKIPGLEIETTNGKVAHANNKRNVSIYLGNEYAPGFFGWTIPTDTRVKIGLCTVSEAPHKVKYYFQKLFTHPGFTCNSQPTTNYLRQATQYISGTIPIGYREKTVTDNVLLVGDAAGQVKPLSGGGIYTSLVCAQYCAETVIEALEKKDYSYQLLKNYENKWHKKFGYEFKRALRLRKIFKNLRDKDIDRIITYLNNEKKLLAMVSKIGDIDYPGKTIFTLLRVFPKAARFIYPLIKSFF